jgi:dolichol-phosphate mannosyltransferase
VITVVVPTYREAENLRPLARAIEAALVPAGLEYEVVYVDDDSHDGSEAICEELASDLPVRIIVRRGERGLSSAVLRGIREARGDLVVVMDADLSHPANAIPAMVELLASGEADFVIGSRYVAGGSIHGEWNLFRRLNSRVPTLMSRPLAALRDPMSGFFALRRASLPPWDRLSPIGYKIALEIFVKGEFGRPREVPIHFGERLHGASKLTLKEQLNFLRHLRKLYLYRYPKLTEFVQFGCVGASGLVVDVAVYLGLQWLFELDHRVARGASFVVAASSNWLLNRLITFSERVRTSKLEQWPRFLATSLIGFLINWGSYTALTAGVLFFDRHRIVALVIGVLLGMFSNFALARGYVFQLAPSGSGLKRDRSGAAPGH